MADDLAQRVADDALKDTFTLQGLQARQRRLASGGLDWNWRGPKNDPEWAWFFNRLNWLPALWKVGKRSKDARYHDCLCKTLADWLAANPAPGRFTISAAWRPLEAARRLTNVFLPLLPDWLASEHFPQSLKTALLDTLSEHARHLRKHHAPGGNHLITEMLALLQTTQFIAERACGETADHAVYALRKLDQEFREQVYPDGTHKELSAHYHRIITQNFTRLHHILATANDPAAPLWRKRLEGLWHYIHAVSKPTGKSPLNNDSDEEDFEKFIQRYHPFPPSPRPPSGSHWFPFAGQAVMRGQTAPHWFLFDAGPRGSDHDHDDLLHCCLSIGDTDFLVDNGRYTYAPGPWRDYFRGFAAHNGVLINDTPPDQGPRTITQPRPGARFAATPEKLTASGIARFPSPAGPAEWQRHVTYRIDQDWGIDDRLIRYGPYRATTLWHWHPDCHISGDLREQGLHIRHGKQSIILRLNTDCPDLTSEIACGRQFPTPQGWHSKRFNQKVPAPCLIITQRATGPLLNQWRLTPA
ncbi:MAG: alginate lyase family protein [Opitutales bacterium]|nr:alginate lyase family protein [Opitutales bacterium]